MAQMSLYPLGEADLSPSIRAAIGELKRHGVEYKTGEMSTVMWGANPSFKTSAQ